MTKARLLGLYRTKLTHIQLTYASLILWSYPDTLQYFDSLHAELRGIPFLFSNVSALIHDKTAMRIACEELYESAHRSAIK
jgi:hypothetical protein